MAQTQTKAQEEKQQKILRALLQEPGNKKCFDCNMKGPVYANLTHATFVCTTCSGIHREFNHRVKSISMANFKPEEIELLKRGGNDAAKRRWLARWTPDDFPEPDTTDQARIRQFMRLKYIDRRWFREDGGASVPSVSDSAPSKSAPRSQSDTRSPHTSVEPLTSLLGNNIPPISFNGGSATSSIGSSTASRGAPPPIAKPSQSGNSLVDWDRPPASSVTGNTLLDDLFTPPSAEQQAQHQLQLQQAAAAQAAQAQVQAQAQQQFQHASIMAQFGQANPMMSQQAWMMNMMQQQQQPGYSTMMPPQNMQGMGGYPYPQPVSAVQSLPTQQTQPIFGGNPSSLGNGGGLMGFGGAPIQPTQPSIQPTQQPVQPQQPPVQQAPPKDDIFAALSPLAAKPQQNSSGFAPIQSQNNQPLRPNNVTATPPSNNNPFGANNDPFGFSSPSPITPQQQQQQQQTSPALQPLVPTSNNPFGANNNNNPFGLNSGPPSQPNSQFGFPSSQSNQPTVVPPSTAPSGLGSFGAGGFPSFSSAPTTQPSNSANLGSFGSQPSNNNNPFGLNSGPPSQPNSQFGFPQQTQPQQPQQNSQFGFGGAQNPQSQFGFSSQPTQPQPNPSGFPNSQFGFSGQPTQPQQPQQFGFPQQTQPQQPQQFGFPGQSTQPPSQQQQQFGFPSQQQQQPQGQQFGFSNQQQAPNPFF